MSTVLADFVLWRSGSSATESLTARLSSQPYPLEASFCENLRLKTAGRAIFQINVFYH